MIKIAIVDDHTVVGEGTKSILSKDPSFDIVYEKSSLNFFRSLTSQHYDVYLIDLDMPDINGLSLAKRILQCHPEAKIIIYTVHDITSHFNQFVEAGVVGFVNKQCSNDELITTIKCAIKDKVILPIEILAQLKRINTIPSQLSEGTQATPISDIEEQILLKVVQGLSNEDIACDLFMSQRNIEQHLTKLFTKANVNSRSELVKKAKQLKLVPMFVL
ncbi:two component transcriptional regulator, LuxR family [Amphibacillus marinus]|uniref:Two component transcriptional regulator, LuxR family n=1 Tax=Amphibacillus marinus TaxID=872970 RepID=A0A1H8KD38_9BACI|nr:response regulator transcription factor [Amphibacillus marinus]SEN90426.1 two component transcriptional regulator, LuxR family [Amphibacillus marinus]